MNHTFDPGDHSLLVDDDHPCHDCGRPKFEHDLAALVRAQALIGNDYVILSRGQLHALISWVIAKPEFHHLEPGGVFSAWIADHVRQSAKPGDWPTREQFQKARVEGAARRRKQKPRRRTAVVPATREVRYKGTV